MIEGLPRRPLHTLQLGEMRRQARPHHSELFIACLAALLVLVLLWRLI